MRTLLVGRPIVAVLSGVVSVALHGCCLFSNCDARLECVYVRSTVDLNGGGNLLPVRVYLLRGAPSGKSFEEIWSPNPDEPPQALEKLCLKMGAGDVLPGTAAMEIKLKPRTGVKTEEGDIVHVVIVGNYGNREDNGSWWRCVPARQVRCDRSVSFELGSSGIKAPGDRDRSPGGE